MSDTVLKFWDFFWIWAIFAVLSGTTYLSSRDTKKLDAIEKQIASLAEEIRGLKAGGAGSPTGPSQPPGT